MHIIDHDKECHAITDDDGRHYPALVTRGCSCCVAYKRVTRENLDTAIAEAEEWLAELRGLEPVDYPPDAEGGVA